MRSIRVGEESLPLDSLLPKLESWNKPNVSVMVTTSPSSENFTLRRGDKVDHNVHRKPFSAGSHRGEEVLELARVESTFRSDFQSKFSRCRFVVHSIDRCSKMLCKLDSLVPQPTDAIDENTLLVLRTELYDIRQVRTLMVADHDVKLSVRRT